MRGASVLHLFRSSQMPDAPGSFPAVSLQGHAECARFLVMKGSSCEAKTSNGQTAFEMCSSQESWLDGCWM
jgi:hypothetical protein